MHRFAHTLLCAAGVAAVAGCTNMAAQIKSSGTMGPADDTYITAAYELIQFDKEAGALAAKQSSDPQVTSISSRILSQATILEPGLTAALKVEGKSPPPDSPQVTSQVSQLKGLHGAAFDRQYVSDELALHKTAVASLKQEDTATKDGAIRLQVERQLPVVQQNLAALQVLSGSLPPT